MCAHWQHSKQTSDQVYSSIGALLSRHMQTTSVIFPPHADNINPESPICANTTGRKPRVVMVSEPFKTPSDRPTGKSLLLEASDREPAGVGVDLLPLSACVRHSGHLWRVLRVWAASHVNLERSLTALRPLKSLWYQAKTAPCLREQQPLHTQQFFLGWSAAFMRREGLVFCLLHLCESPESHLRYGHSCQLLTGPCIVNFLFLQAAASLSSVLLHTLGKVAVSCCCPGCLICEYYPGMLLT